jgi:hypothetical protein
VEYNHHPNPRTHFLPICASHLGRLSRLLLSNVDVAPHSLHPDIPQYFVNYTFENPTSALLHLETHIESSDVCTFAGPKQVRVGLMPFTSHVMRLIVLPVGREWVRLPRLIAMDDERKTVLEVLRLSNDLKVEGPDLYLRVPSSDSGTASVISEVR